MSVTATRFVERMTENELAIAARVDSVLDTLRVGAVKADASGEFVIDNVALLRDAGLLGLVVPTEYGGLGGTLRDLAAATYALGTACPSTALAYFFHCSTASRGLLTLEAADAGAFDPADEPVVRTFAEKLLHKMGTQQMWLANFASETVKSAASAITISTEARRTDGGWLVSGVKSFGCSTGVADEYLVTAKLAGSTGADGLALFFVDRDAPGVAERQHWDAIGMRGTATHGIVLTDAFVADDNALTVPGAFTKMMQMSRGSFVGSQLAATAVYLGAAQAVYDIAIANLCDRQFEDTGRPIGEAPYQQMLVGDMAVDLETAYLWLRRQLELETSEPPLLPKADVVTQWRMCKGEVAEACFRVGMAALKTGGTSATTNSGPMARGLRDLAMGLVQAFPAERGRAEVASVIISDRAQAQFGLGTSGS